MTTKGGASARRWAGWRTKGPVFPLEVIITRRRDAAERDAELARREQEADRALSRLQDAADQAQATAAEMGELAERLKEQPPDEGHVQ